MAGMFSARTPLTPAGSDGMFAAPTNSQFAKSHEMLTPDALDKPFGTSVQPSAVEEELPNVSGQPKILSLDDLEKLPDLPAQPATRAILSLDDLNALPDPSSPAPVFRGRGPNIDPKQISTERSNQFLADFGRDFAQNATFNYSDEIIAKVRQTFGEDYASALEAERKELAAARERIGTAGQAVSLGTSMLMPMGPIAKVVQRMAGPGAGLLRTGAASAAVMAPIGGVAGVGALDDKSDLGTDAEAFGWGAGTAAGTAGALHTVAVPVVRLGKRVAKGIGDVASRGVEFAHYRNGSPSPLASTTRFAVNKLADAAELGGMRSPHDLRAGIAEFSVPDTPSALVNTRNDRLAAEAIQSAADLNRPNVPRIVNGQRENSNVFQALHDAQATNANGHSQGDAFRGRLFESADVPDWDRSLPDVLHHNRQQREYRALQLQDLSRPPPGMNYNSSSVPGFVAALDDPDFAREYRNAARALSKPGSHDSIPADQIPLLPDDYHAAVQAGLQPVPLTDAAIPMPILSLMRRNISAATQAEGTPAGQENARRLLALYDHLAGGRVSGNVQDLNRINREMHELHNDAENIIAGYKIPTQTGPTRGDAIAGARMQPGYQQDNVALGMVHGVADASKATNDNLGALADDIFANPDFRQAFDEFVPGRSPQARPAEDLRAELHNVGNMQGVSALLRAVSERRKIDTPSLPAEALSFLIHHKVAPTIGYAHAAHRLFAGKTQARTAEAARLLTDTSGEGIRRLSEELARRNASASAARNNSPPLARTLLLNEIARQLAAANVQSP